MSPSPCCGEGSLRFSLPPCGGGLGWGVTPRPRLVMHVIPGINGRLTTNNCRLRMRWQNRTPPAHTIKIRRPISLPSAHYETVSPSDCRHATYANRSISLLVAPYRIRFKQYLVGDCPHFCTRKWGLSPSRPMSQPQSASQPLGVLPATWHCQTAPGTPLSPLAGRGVGGLSILGLTAL